MHRSARQTTKFGLLIVALAALSLAAIGTVSAGRDSTTLLAAVDRPAGGDKIGTHSAGLSPQTVEVAAASDTTQTMVFTRNMGAEGIVVSAQTGDPIPYVWVSVYRVGNPTGGGTGRSARLWAADIGAARVAGVAGPLPDYAGLGEAVAVGVTDERGYFLIEVPYDGDYLAIADGPGWYLIPESEDRGDITAEAPVLSMRLELSRLDYFTNQEMPARVSFPKLGMQGPVVLTGVEPDGTMESPTDPDTIGWFSGAAGLWTRGNIVLAGHINWSGRTRLFGYLDRLQPGDQIVLTDARGRQATYQIEWNRILGATTAPDDIIAQGTREEITLITCDGQFDTRIRQYLGRRIVRGVRIG